MGSHRIWGCDGSSNLSSNTFQGKKFSLGISPRTFIPVARKPPELMEAMGDVVIEKASIKKTLLGHKARAFDVRYCSQHSKVITASEDGSCKIWDYTSGRCLNTVFHNREAEVLRAAFVLDSLVCTAGSDGNAILWKYPVEGSKLEKVKVLSHGEDAQVYVCESNSSDLLIAADDFLVLWDLQSMERRREFTFTQSTDATEPSFGGHRNPNNQVFVFDAKLNPANSNVVAVALSDSTTRFIDTRTEAPQCFGSLSLMKLFSRTSERIGHATSISWSDDSFTMAVSLGSGQTALVDTRQQQVRALLRSHAGPCYGSLLVDSGSKCISWSSDCTIRSWDSSTAQGICSSPFRIQSIPDFPILSAAWDHENRNLLCGGGGGSTSGSNGSGGATGGSDGGSAPKNRLKPGFSFMGTPVYILNNILPAIAL